MKRNIVCLVLFVFVATGFPEVIQITSGNFNRQNVSGDGHSIVFEDDSTGDIGVYDAWGDSVFFPIHREGVETDPDICGQHIVCQSSGIINVLYGRMSDGWYCPLTSSTHFQGDACVCSTSTGIKIGWTDERYGGSYGRHPLYYDPLIPSEEFILTEADQRYFILSINFGAWIETSDSSVWATNLLTREIFRISPMGLKCQDLYIYNDTLFFVGGLNIYRFDFDLETLAQLTNNEHNETFPVYKNGHVVFFRERLIVLLEIETGLETIIRDDDREKESLVILDSGIFWSEMIDGYFQIFFSPFIFLDVEEERIEKPKEFKFSAYPNPFNSICHIEAPLGSKIDIFDINGHQVASLASNDWQPNETVNSGIYFVRCEYNDQSKFRKIVYCK